MSHNTDVCHEMFSTLATAKNQLLQLIYARQVCHSTLDELEFSPVGRSALNCLRQSANVVDDFLFSLIDLACLSKGLFQPSREEFSIKSLLYKVQDSYSDEAHSHGIDFMVEIDSTIIVGDPGLIEKMLKRLVVNALYFQGATRVSIRCLRKSNRLAIVIGSNAPLLRVDGDDADNADIRAALDVSKLNNTVARRLGRLLSIPLRLRSTPRGGITAIIDLPISSKSPPGAGLLKGNSGARSARAVVAKAGSKSMIKIRTEE